jgi:hypothetical protein
MVCLTNGVMVYEDENQMVSWVMLVAVQFEATQQKLMKKFVVS